MRIELVGSPGCGKTTLARAFMDLGVNTCFESVLKNPYLEKSYSDDTYRFPAQLQFALMKLDEYEKHSQAPLTVFDQGLATCYVFNDLTPDKHEREALAAVLNCVETRHGLPAHLIYVKCAPETQLQRIHARGRGFENLSTEELSKLSDDIMREASEMASESTALQTVDTTHWGFDDYRAFAYEFLLKHRLDMLCNLAKKVV